MLQGGLAVFGCPGQVYSLQSVSSWKTVRSCYFILPFSDVRRRGPREPRFSIFPEVARIALEVQLQSELHKPRIARPLDAAEVRAVGRIPIGLEELGVVERVEELSPEFQPGPLAELRDLLEADLPIVDSRSAANGPRGIPNRT